MAKNLWWVTRPTRDLHDLEMALKCFVGLARGKKWKGNRVLHKKFELENPAKTPNTGSYGSEGSGGRTWAAWLRMWNMWYDDENVKLTSGAELIISVKNPSLIHKQIVHQIMCFQITSAYHASIGCDSEFRIFPFRFILKLLLDNRIKFLSLDEIGLFLLQIRTSREYENVVHRIIDWRKKIKDLESKKILKNLLTSNHMKKYAQPRKDSPMDVTGYWRSIRDIASTFAINISYISEIDYDNKKSIITVQDHEHDMISKLLIKYEKDIKFSTMYEYSEDAFVRKAGIRYDRRKASEKITKPITASQKKIKRIEEAISKLKEQGTIMKGQKLINQIKAITNYNTNTISDVLTKNPQILPISTSVIDQEFVEYYLSCAKSGDEYSEFENLTRTIFTKMGFPTEKRKIPKPHSHLEIDGLILNSVTGLSGLLECKAGSKYTFPVGDCDKMSHSYIPYFRNKRINKQTYALDFFVYVVGQQASGINNFREIAEKTDVRGSVIYARDLLHLYGLVKDGKITTMKMWGLFKGNKHITWADIE